MLHEILQMENMDKDMKDKLAERARGYKLTHADLLVYHKRA